MKFSGNIALVLLAVTGLALRDVIRAFAKF